MRHPWLVGSLLAEEGFQAFSAQHFGLLAITAAGVAGAVWWGRSHRGTPGELAARRGFAVVSLTVALGMQVYWLTPDVRNVHSSWRLQLSDLADYTAIFALWTRGPRTAAFTYYIGLSLTLMAVLTPSLGQSFPDPRWLGFWVRHIFVVWARLPRLGPRHAAHMAALPDRCHRGPRVGCGGVHLQRRHGHQLRLPCAHAGRGYSARWFGPWPWYLPAAATLPLTLWALVFTLPSGVRERLGVLPCRRRPAADLSRS